MNERRDVTCLLCNYVIRLLKVIGDGVTSFSGRLSRALPTLEDIHAELIADLYPGSVETSIDAFMLHPNLRRSVAVHRFQAKADRDATAGNC